MPAENVPAIPLFSLMAVGTGSCFVYAILFQRLRRGLPLVPYAERNDTDLGGVLSWIKRRPSKNSDEVAKAPKTTEEINRQLVEDVLLGIGAFLFAFPPVIMVHALLQWFFPYNHPLIDEVFADRSWQVFVKVAISAALLAPILEEFVFRNVLQGSLEVLGRLWVRKTGVENPWVTRVEPICISSVAFAAAHLGQGAAPFPLFLFAIVLGYLYFQTHRLMPSIVAHAALNGFSVMQIWFIQ